MLYRANAHTARYNMEAEFYQQTNVQQESGQIIRTWDYANPIMVRNNTKPIIGGGIRVVGSTERWEEEYEGVEWVKMMIASQDVVDYLGEPVKIVRRFRVGKIRLWRTGESLWVGDDGLDIEFNVQGITPYHDPYQPVEYELLLKGVVDE
jgi:hypothetical protein